MISTVSVTKNITGSETEINNQVRNRRKANTKITEQAEPSAPSE